MAFRRHFTITIPTELVPALERIYTAESFSTEPQLILALVRQSLAATPSQGAAAATRSAGFNEARWWTLRMVNQALADIKKMIEKEIPADEDQSRPASSEDGPVQP